MAPYRLEKAREELPYQFKGGLLIAVPLDCEIAILEVGMDQSFVGHPCYTGTR